MVDGGGGRVVEAVGAPCEMRDELGGMHVRGRLVEVRVWQSSCHSRLVSCISHDEQWGTVDRGAGEGGL